MKKKDLLIGFCGQGFIGKSYADDFEERGYKIIRYDRSKFSDNRDLIKKCDYVFIAVPTPSINQKFDYSIVKEVLKLVGDNKVAIIKSTLAIGVTEKLQKLFPKKYIIHSPEFLREATAKKDAKYPERNVVGYTKKSKRKAELVMKLLPNAPYKFIVKSDEAELIKYAGNCFLYIKVLLANTAAELCYKNNINYDKVIDVVSKDSRIGKSHTDIIHKSGRGAGGNCFIKDFNVYKGMHKGSKTGQYILDFLTYAERYNNKLLINSKKDLDILKKVYGKPKKK